MIESLYQHFLNATGVSTDTRSIQKGQIFFALNGPNFNANKFAASALESGASLAVVDDEAYATDKRYFLVKDGLTALQELARHHRKQLQIPVIAITGSNGKTSTKELIRDVLSRKYKVLATKGNLNNHIGVPLTLLSITPDIEIAVVEMGANHIGEIAALCELALPDHGLITNIGKAHLEGFGSFEGVIRGKSELYNYLIQNEGVVFVNSQNEILANMAQRRIASPVYYPAAGDFLHAELLATQPSISFQSESKEEVHTQLTGAYNFENICAALCVGKYFKVSEAEANEAVSAYVPENNRSQIIQKGELTIILDAYNANPSSMRAALENLQAQASAHKTAILGDMFELGEEGPQEHKALGELTRQLGIDQVLYCGEMMKAAYDANPNSSYFESKEGLVEFLKNNPVSNGTVLIKGSRGIGLETILEYL